MTAERARCGWGWAQGPQRQCVRAAEWLVHLGPGKCLCCQEHAEELARYTPGPFAVDDLTGAGRVFTLRQLGADLDAAGKTEAPNDAHIFTGQCQMRIGCGGGGRRAFLVTLLGDQWAEPTRTTNGRRDTVEACADCASWWRGSGGTSRVKFRPLPFVPPRPPSERN